MIARWYNRFPQEFFFGITIYYGAIFLIGLFIVCGAISYLASGSFVRWFPIVVGLLAWLAWFWPSFETRPIAMPSIFAIGSLILIVGSGFGISPCRLLAIRKAKGEQDAT